MYIEDIQLAMTRIAEYIKGLDFNNFKKDYKTVDAVIRNFEVMLSLEESNRIEFKEKLTDKFEREVVRFLNYQGWNYIYWY